MTSDPVLLIGGTHDYAGTEADASRWYWPGDGKHPASPWVQRARALGLTVLGDPGAPFVWSTDVEGWVPRLFRRSSALPAWKAAGEAVREYCWARGVRRVQLVGWSHGGQVAAYAAARRLPGFRVTTLITLATPIRGDMAVVYKAARAGVTWWAHVHGGRRDWWQLAGELVDGSLGWRRAMPQATQNLAIATAGHDDLVAVETWNRFGLWRLLR
jgi:pimeloyl-ACP methyl ester carboxylesterase